MPGLAHSYLCRTQIGMTTEPNRKPEGIPTGGQFAAQLKSDDVVSLGQPARRPELEGWPASLPEPTVSFDFTDDGQVVTNATMPNGDEINVWDKNNGSEGYESDAMGSWEGVDDEDMEQAEEWLSGRHQIIAGAVKAEQQAAVDRTHAAILAKATGVPVPQSDEDLEQLISASFVTYNAVQRDGELASTALIARGVLKDYPEAAYVGLQVEGADNGNYVSGLAVYNADKELLGSYEEEFYHDADDEEEPGKPRGEEFRQHLNNLPANPLNSHWQQYSPRTYDDFDEYAIDLKKAAAWTPGSAA